MLYDAPRFLDVGEAALSVEFGDAVDASINARVLALDAALRGAALPGVVETVPTYRALMINYDPLALPRAALIAGVTEAIARTARAGETNAPSKTLWRLPCCYDPAIAEDILEVAAVLNLSAGALAKTHAGLEHRAYMYGFAPGWCYLGAMPPALAVPRRKSPRGPTPRGAVLIGGGLSLIGANPMPTGWYVIGRTPERLFAPTREPPLLIAPGDAIRFEPVDPATFTALDERAARGDVVTRRELLA
jgi:KipI family sensor histidine kinase inhibitor